MVAELVPMVLVLLLPLSVHAGVFSTLVELLQDDTEISLPTEVVDYSASATPLLSAHYNPESATRGGGDVLVVDGAVVSTGPVGEDEIQNSEYRTGEIRVHTVRPCTEDSCETISHIADMYGVTTNTILWANDIADATRIQAGDELVILPIVGVQHEVAEGESLSDIVDEYEADFDEVLAYNGLASADQLGVGDILIIPGGEVSAPARIAYTPTPTKTSGSVSNGSFSHPAPHAIRTQGIHGYNAVDFAAGYGSPIYAADNGEVIVSKNAGWNGGYGNYVVIDHKDGTQTLYAHNSQNYVGVGEWVKAGQAIAAMGSTGRSTGVHLHFEVRGSRNPF